MQDHLRDLEKSRLNRRQSYRRNMCKCWIPSKKNNVNAAHVKEALKAAEIYGINLQNPETV